MNKSKRRAHWENIYTTRLLEEVSWYQPVPGVSLNFFERYHIPFNARIMDAGGGDSLLVDHLLDRGYRDITVLDISSKAISRAKERLGKRADRVTWIVADVVDHVAAKPYDFWHDRAVFHFLTEESDVVSYVNRLNHNIVSGGHLVIGTFATDGPSKCSGIDVQRYSEQSLSETLQPYFQKKECVSHLHMTPGGKTQNFIFCSFLHLGGSKK